MSMRSTLARVNRFQQSHTVTAFPVAVVTKFSEDGAPSSAALIAYWAFFSVFPLLLAFVSILGFALKHNPEFQHDVLSSTLAHLPVLGAQIRSDIGSLEENGVGLAIGIIGAVWAGLGVTLAIGEAFDEIWAVRQVKRSGFISSRLRGLVLLTVFGISVVASTAVVNLARTGALEPGAVRVIGFIASVVVDFAVFFVSFRVLTSAEVTARQVAPGALLATLAWFVMQTLGGLFVEHTLANSSLTYGAFAAVIGLLTWLLIAAEMMLMCAEVNVVMAQRLWPRSFFGRLSRADRRALRRAVEAEQRSEQQRIAVEFDSGAEGSEAGR